MFAIGRRDHAAFHGPRQFAFVADEVGRQGLLGGCQGHAFFLGSRCGGCGLAFVGVLFFFLSTLSFGFFVGFSNLFGDDVVDGFLQFLCLLLLVLDVLLDVAFLFLEVGHLFVEVVLL